MSYLRGFLPWIAFAVVSSADWRWAALLALLLSIGLLVRDRRSGVRLDAQILDLGSIAFFVLLTVVAFVDPHSVLHQFDNSLSGAWLAMVAWLTLAVRRPFTSGFARRQAPPEVWETPAFKHTNTVLTLAWTIALSGIAVCAFIGDALNAPLLFNVTYEVIGYGSAIWFTKTYVEKVRAAVAR
jgi:hypothetical protein